MMNKNGQYKDLSVVERLRHLELKVDGGFNWLKNPQLFMHQDYQCKNMTDLGTDHHVCLDGFQNLMKKNNGGCIVYDLGIRKNPEFGVEMMTKYGCSVRAYDPSPTTQKWWEGKDQLDTREAKMLKVLKDAGTSKYDLQFFAASGQDGPLELYEYNWDQVSIYRAEDDVSRDAVKARGGKKDVEPPRAFSLEAKTLGTMMKDHGDTYVDFLKIDIEGSEYTFMQDIFDRMGCPPVGQIALEYHHFSLDDRYGSSPELNQIHNMLNACGFKSFQVRDHWRNDVDLPGNGRQSPPMRYTLVAFCKEC